MNTLTSRLKDDNYVICPNRSKKSKKDYPYAFIRKVSDGEFEFKKILGSEDFTQQVMDFLEGKPEIRKAKPEEVSAEKEEEVSIEKEQAIEEVQISEIKSEEVKKQIQEIIPKAQFVSNHQDLSKIEKGQVLVYLSPDGKNDYVRTYLLGKREGFPVVRDPKADNFYLNVINKMKTNYELSEIIKAQFPRKEIKIVTDQEGLSKISEKEIGIYITNDNEIYLQIDQATLIKAPQNELQNEIINHRLSTVLDNFAKPELYQFSASNLEEALKMLESSNSQFINVAFIEKTDGVQKLTVLTKSFDEIKEKEFQGNKVTSEGLAYHLENELKNYELKRLKTTVRKEIEGLNISDSAKKSGFVIKFIESESDYDKATKSVSSKEILVNVQGKEVFIFQKPDEAYGLELTQDGETYLDFLKYLIK